MSSPSTKERPIPDPSGVGNMVTVSTFPSGQVNTVKTSGVPDLPKGRQVTTSEGHPFMSRNKDKNRNDLGGDFTTNRQFVAGKKFPSVTLNDKRTADGIVTSTNYIGPMLPVNPTGLVFPPDLSSSNAALDSVGATAVARCKPTNSVASASVALGELLKDGLPHLVGHRTWEGRAITAKSAGDEFLNVEFGWNPLISDIRSFSMAVRNANAVLTQFERDSGRNVRRRYEFPVQTTKQETLWDGPNRCYINPFNSNLLNPAAVLGPAYRIRTTIRRQWFSGAFTYRIPLGTSLGSTLRRQYLEAGKLLGTNLTPETLWNLAPWSWAADWFSNAGDVVSNLSDAATYGLVLRYGYVMEETITTDTYVRIGDTGFKSGAGGVTTTLVNHTKKRRRANPFGFGVTYDGLNPIQYAILAALGMSRS